ncbi:MAG: THUMP domain-containing protein [Planctomycetota bacterium]
MAGGRATFFATCAPGIEPILHAEARALKLGRTERQVGGVRFEGTLRDAWRANLHLRTAIRVLLRLSRFEARTGDELYDGVQEFDWRRFLTPDSTLLVSAQSKESDLDHSLFIEQRTKDAIVDQFASRDGRRPTVDKESPDLVVHTHFWRDRCTLSVDTSGMSLHKRGWRQFQGQAPLSETLAAAIVLLSDWDRRAPFLDPFCGSGTLLIEAGLIAKGVPPGAFRHFAFERFPGHDDRAWEKMRSDALNDVKAPRKLTVRGAELDPVTLRGAQENIEAAGLEDLVAVEEGSALEFPFKSGWNAWVVTNPPYGERIGDSDQLRDLYSDFGEILRERCGGYKASVLSGNPSLSRALGIKPRGVSDLFNGSIPCELLHLEP